MKVWLISDTHGKELELDIPEDIDMIISAGDGGTYKNPYHCKRDLVYFLEWFNKLPIKYKVYIPGNHDTAMEAGLIDAKEYPEIHMIIHESLEIEGIKMFGSPYTPWFYDWAYNSTEKELKELWKDIPEGLDFLITHGPPNGILDRCEDGYRAGCEQLLNVVKSMKPRYHVFGHIHEDGGKQELHDETLFINASVLDLSYMKSNNGYVLDIQKQIS